MASRYATLSRCDEFSRKHFFDISRSIECGSRMSCDIVCCFPMASANHCVFIFFGSKLGIVDRWTFQGTYINGVKIPSGVLCYLNEGDFVTLGGRATDVHLLNQIRVESVVVIPRRDVNGVFRPMIELPPIDNPIRHVTIKPQLPERYVPGAKPFMLEFPDTRHLDGDEINVPPCATKILYPHIYGETSRTAGSNAVPRTGPRLDKKASRKRKFPQT